MRRPIALFALAPVAVVGCGQRNSLERAARGTSAPRPDEWPALAGAKDLAFVPAKVHGEPVAAHILFPAYFGHPEAPALPGDTALRAPGRGANDA